MQLFVLLLVGGGAVAFGALRAGPAHRDAEKMLAALRLPPAAVRLARQPAGAGGWLSSSPSVAVFSGLVDVVEFWEVRGDPASVVAWVERHRPAGSTQGDSGAGDSSMSWTAFDFPNVGLRLAARELVVDVAQLPGGVVGIRVDAQSAALPKLPGNGSGPGAIRIVQPAGPLIAGSYGFDIRCDPAGGTVPDPVRVCATIRADPALLYSHPGPDHSCPPITGVGVVLSGRWDGKPLHSSFSVCIGGQEAEADAWAKLLPGVHGWTTAPNGIGLVKLGATEDAIGDLLRGWGPTPRACSGCTLAFTSGWRITFAAGRATQIENDSPEQVISSSPLSFSTLSWSALRRRLRTWRARTCGSKLELIHPSPSGTTAAIYGAHGFRRLVVAKRLPSCA
jgi:hypothetical protein